MNWKRLSGISLLLNAGVLAWVFSSSQKTGAGSDLRRSDTEVRVLGSQLTSPRPESVVPTFDWSQIESTNYLEYIGNLRSIGCPEQTIRDIVSADVAATLRGIAFSAASAPTAGAWRENPERLVNELMEGSDASRTTPSNRDVDVVPGIAVETRVARDNRGLPDADFGPGMPKGTPPFVSGSGAAPDDGKESASDLAAATDPFALGPELARQRWIATYLSTRYGQQAWNDLQQQSAAFGGDMDALLEHRSISIPDPPQRPLPVTR